MTIGLDRNNPWNLLPEHVPWLGLTPAQPDSGPLQFDTLVDGIRAGVKLCYTYQGRGLDTPESFVTSFSPPPENPTEQYIADVCAWTGFTNNQQLDFHNPAIMLAWARAIFRQEQGANDITDIEINQGIADAQQ